MKIGFSKFCSMRPKWCVTSSSSGILIVCVCVWVCVCSYHQNAVLLTNGANINENYKFDGSSCVWCRQDLHGALLQQLPW